MKEEYIICAANYYNDGVIYVHQPNNIEIGFVVCGRRHHNCIYTMSIVTKYGKENEVIKLSCIQGFLTNTNRFVDRKEAYTIAFNANQIIGPNKGRATNEIGLTSEDLY